MNDTAPTESPRPAPVPADDPARALTRVSPDTDDSLPHLGVVGDTYTILVSGADTAGRYTLIDMHVPPGGGPPPHRHDFEEMFTILDGEIELTFRGVSAVATAGENDQCAGQRPSRLSERLRPACATALSLLARRPGGVLQGGRRSGRAANRGPAAARRGRHGRVHRQGDRTRPEVQDRAAARRAEALIRETVKIQWRGRLDQLLRDAPRTPAPTPPWAANRTYRRGVCPASSGFRSGVRFRLEPRS
jgi:hypothetical protein